MIYTRFYVILLSAVLVVTGCASSIPVDVESSEIMPIAETTIFPETTLLGTLNGQLLFATKGDEETLYTYDVTTGQQHTIYVADNPMRHVFIHPSGKTLLIISAKSDTVAHVALWTNEMEQLYEVDVASHEIVATFDQTNEQQFSVTAFTKNYEATVYTYVNNAFHIVDAQTPFVQMRDGQLYTLTNRTFMQEKHMLAQNAAHILVGASDVYYVTADAPRDVQTNDTTWTLPNDVVSLHEQHGQVYAWIQNNTQYELFQLQQMTPILTADAPVPFVVDVAQRFVVYGERYEWLQQQGQSPVKWLSINER